ncbi:bacterio-opsin activator domain-containing protein [Haladaptatus sp. NG-WS-4]
MSRERETGLVPDERVASTVGDGVYQLDTTGHFVSVNDAVVAVTGYDREELLGAHVTLVVAEDDAARVEAEIGELLATGPEDVRTTELSIRTADGKSVPCELRFSVVREDGDFVGTVGVARDVSSREKRDAERKAQRDELERLRRINTVIRSIDRAVVRAETTDEIEQAVCNRLANADPYRFSLVATFDPQFRELDVKTWAGIDDEYVELVQQANFDISAGPGATAARTKTAYVVQDIERGDYDWSGPASECGFQSMATVPLIHDETVYGVLAVYSDRPYAFDESERTVLSELGEMVGHAFAAVKSRQALVAERVVELEFRLEDDDHFFTALSGREDCTIRFEDAVFRSDGLLLLYLSVSAADPARIVEATAESPSVTHLRVVREGEDECLLELHYEESSAFTTLADYGGVVRSAVSDDGVGHVLIDLPETESVREVVDAMAGVFETTELVSRKTVKRSVETRGQFRDTLDQRLTDRQRNVLRAAYRAGYFEWPRETTGEELATSLDISAPTLHKHLRLAEAIVLSALFDDTREAN